MSEKTKAIYEALEGLDNGEQLKGTLRDILATNNKSEAFERKIRGLGFDDAESVSKMLTEHTQRGIDLKSIQELKDKADQSDKNKDANDSLRGVVEDLKKKIEEGETRERLKDEENTKRQAKENKLTLIRGALGSKVIGVEMIATDMLQHTELEVVDGQLELLSNNKLYKGEDSILELLNRDRYMDFKNSPSNDSDRKGSGGNQAGGKRSDKEVFEDMFK